MRIAPLDWTAPNLDSALFGVSSPGLTGSILNITSAQGSLSQSVLGSGPSVTSNTGGGSYTGGGVAPGTGSPGGQRTSTGGTAGNAGGNIVGGQDPSNSATPPYAANTAPPDRDDGYDLTVDYTYWSGLGGTGNTIDQTYMPAVYLNPSNQPQPVPGALLGCIPCWLREQLARLAAGLSTIF